MISLFLTYNFLMAHLCNLYDNEKPVDRLIILGSSRGLKVVSRSKILLTDGTFKSATTTLKTNWYQIFVIHAEFMETGEIFPCIFCLMQHRTKENYDEIYKEVHRLIRDLIRSCQEGKCIWTWRLQTNVLSKNA